MYSKKHHLLTGKEARALGRHHDMDRSGLSMKELVAWCQEDIAYASSTKVIDNGKENNFHEHIMDFRTAMDQLYNYTEQPPHFFCIHFLVLLSALYLPLFAIESALSAGWGAETREWLEFVQGLTFQHTTPCSY